MKIISLALTLSPGLMCAEVIIVDENGNEKKH